MTNPEVSTALCSFHRTIDSKFLDKKKVSIASTSMLLNSLPKLITLMDVLREGFTLIKQSFHKQFSNLADIEIFIW